MGTTCTEQLAPRKHTLTSAASLGHLDAAHEAKMRLGLAVIGAEMAETTRLWDTICAWWSEIEVLIVTGATNARTEWLCQAFLAPACRSLLAPPCCSLVL